MYLTWNSPMNGRKTPDQAAVPAKFLDSRCIFDLPEKSRASSGN